MSKMLVSSSKLLVDALPPWADSCADFSCKTVSDHGRPGGKKKGKVNGGHEELFVGRLYGLKVRNWDRQVVLVRGKGVH